ncbi:DUF2971 domain-containing protein [Burkholderia ubonensis]|nr:DUF2971 domain-containing protein [Burkholderia ubonensis]KVS40155.1 hypothetical protein WK37_23390 [Burkholderia ubonensis]KVS51635.1 hypothetical protein WK38_00420 [Burkholderia ubonensis]KVS81279.1 hypothetical protein WK44_28395 [Burkholderia ubonensis]KVS84125.1 hypothetical protein WK42_06740 [Burkholderia ubonensis]KVS95458.1 hypothetical protein WK43_07910 [Burkholderia ubonensis]
MNDLEELRFGMLIGRERFRSHVGLRNMLSARQHYDAFRNLLENQFDGFARVGAFDVYVACFAEHQPDDRDGLLSMWRGYGANGNGACIVFDTGKLNVVPESPLIIGKVEYADRDTRIRWVDGILDIFCELFARGQWNDDNLKLAAWVLFERLLVFSLYTKHQGFSEEQEWRLTYMKHRDSHGLLSDMLDYHIGPRGIEPKLKFKIRPLEGATDSSMLVDSLVHSIILGPTASADIHRLSAERMLKSIGREALISKVVSSSIPFRSN